jgi:hypothetical protein
MPAMDNSTDSDHSQNALRPDSDKGRWRLSRRARQVLLLTHIIAAGSWLGIDVAFGILVLVALRADGAPTTSAAFVLAIAAFAGWPLAGIALLTLGTGLLLGVGTRYGLLRYRWVVAKLTLTLTLVVLVLAVLVPKVLGLGDSARASLVGGSPMPPFADLAFPPAVSVVVLLTAMTLAVVKPGGRKRRRHLKQSRVVTGNQDPLSNRR